MPHDADRLMFEVYRDRGDAGGYHVVYFTELDDHRRDAAIEAAMAGEHVFGGFLHAASAPAAKAALSAFTASLGPGAMASEGAVARLLAPFLVPRGTP